MSQTILTDYPTVMCTLGFFSNKKKKEKTFSRILKRETYREREREREKLQGGTQNGTKEQICPNDDNRANDVKPVVTSALK